MVRMTATDVSRNFSLVLNRVDAGEEIEIVRNGSAIAELRPPSRPRGISGSAFKALMERLPALDEDFARDVAEARRALGPPVSKWPSS
ncbi:MAG TPA: type II toxin-antitoxin system prevent-host-death family antitoxin [Solirubrobacteraceae bacterium]|jgi:antitoxin (DNA-binding transcriptional repressor) of toxin-antitoxin stability system